MVEPELNKDILQKKPIFREEFRLGLVVYGGVALAIYMNGVCREFYNAMRGRGIYKLIKALTDSDIIVDIISGTSAGGINGVLLSYALANSTETEVIDFKNFANLWRDRADIQELLRQPSLATPADIDSILDGENYYQSKLKEAFSIGKSPVQAKEHEWFSESDELNLFVTGTDVLGRVYKVLDSTGSVIEVKDHRSVFLLKHRVKRREPFKPSEETAQSLAKLCRITSCFPVAFPVVEVQLEGGHKDDTKLVEWGRLKNRELPQVSLNDGYSLYFVDGGVLDNRPFTYTIKEMYYHAAYRPVNRKLLYIDPSPDRFLNSPIFNTTQKPGVGKIVLDSLVGMPRYESIGSDLELVKDHNEKVRRYKYQLAALKDLDTNQLSSIVASDGNIQEGAYLRSRLVSLRDRVLPLILRLDREANPKYPRSQQNQQDILETTADLLTKYVTQGEGQEEGKNRNKRQDQLEEIAKQIRNLDVEYALRKHFYIVQHLCGLISNGESDEYREIQLLIGKLSRQIKLLEVTRTALDNVLISPEVSHFFYELIENNKFKLTELELQRKVYDFLLRLHRFILDADVVLDGIPSKFFKELLLEAKRSQYSSLAVVSQHTAKDIDLKQEIGKWLSKEQIQAINSSFGQKIANLTQLDIKDICVNGRYKYLGKENDSKNFTTILRRIERASEGLIRYSGLRNKHQILAQFRKFRQIDQVLYPLEYLSGISEKELIQTVRISPIDAQLGLGRGKGVEEKLAGDTLRAFGGFFKRSWRSNDILWGRLDGLNRITEALVTPKSIKNFFRFLEQQELVQSNPKNKEVYINILLEECFPKAKPNDLNKLKNYLYQLSQGADLGKNFKDFLHELVLAGHRQIIEEDLQNVVEDAILEQLNWNQQQVKTSTNFEQILKQIRLNNGEIIGIQNKTYLDQLNELIKTLVNPNFVNDFPKFLNVQAKETNSTQYLNNLFRQSFPQSTEKDCENLMRCLDKFVNPSFKASDFSFEELQEFLIRLLLAVRREMIVKDVSDAMHKDMIEQMEQFKHKLDQILKGMKPQYQPASGYFDRTLTPLAAATIAQDTLAVRDKEDFFRNNYTVGSEKVLKDIPDAVLLKLATQATLLARDLILKSLGTDLSLRLQRNRIYQFFDKSLQLLYWVQARKLPFRLGIQLILLLIVAVAVVIAIPQLYILAVAKVPFYVWLAIAGIAILLYRSLDLGQKSIK